MISGNGKAGIYLQDGTNNAVRGNYIGLNATGTAAITNGNNGVIIDNSADITVGGAGVGEGVAIAAAAVGDVSGVVEVSSVPSAACS